MRSLLVRDQILIRLTLHESPVREVVPFGSIVCRSVRGTRESPSQKDRRLFAFGFFGGLATLALSSQALRPTLWVEFTSMEQRTLLLSLLGLQCDSHATRRFVRYTLTKNPEFGPGLS